MYIGIRNKHETALTTKMGNARDFFFFFFWGGGREKVICFHGAVGTKNILMGLVNKHSHGPG